MSKTYYQRDGNDLLINLFIILINSRKMIVNPYCCFTISEPSRQLIAGIGVILQDESKKCIFVVLQTFPNSEGSNRKLKIVPGETLRIFMIKTNASIYIFNIYGENKDLQELQIQQTTIYYLIQGFAYLYLKNNQQANKLKLSTAQNSSNIRKSFVYRVEVQFGNSQITFNRSQFSGQQLDNRIYGKHLNGFIYFKIGNEYFFYAFYENIINIRKEKYKNREENRQNQYYYLTQELINWKNFKIIDNGQENNFQLQSIEQVEQVEKYKQYIPFPYNSIGKLRINLNNQQQTGTCFFLHNYQCQSVLLLTCGHNIKDRNNDFTNRINQFKISLAFEQDKAVSQSKWKVKEVAQLKVQKIVFFPQFKEKINNNLTLKYDYRSQKHENRIEKTIFYDIALIYLKRPYLKQLGFEFSIGSYQFNKNNRFEMSGFPRYDSGMLVKQHKLVQNQIYRKYFVQDQQNKAIYNLSSDPPNENIHYKVLRHMIKSDIGSSGSPLYEQHDNKLHAIHTTNLKTGNGKYDSHKFATDLHRQDIRAWLFKQPGFLPSIKQLKDYQLKLLVIGVIYFKQIDIKEYGYIGIYENEIIVIAIRTQHTTLQRIDCVYFRPFHKRQQRPVEVINARYKVERIINLNITGIPHLVMLKLVQLKQNRRQLLKQNAYLIEPLTRTIRKRQQFDPSKYLEQNYAGIVKFVFSELSEIDFECLILEQKQKDVIIGMYPVLKKSKSKMQEKNLKEVVNYNEHPYSSIGIFLSISDKRVTFGTASLIRGFFQNQQLPKKCRFLITTASRFLYWWFDKLIDLISNFEQNCFCFKYFNKSSIKWQPTIELIQNMKESKISIKKIHINNKYMQLIKKSPSLVKKNYQGEKTDYRRLNLIPNDYLVYDIAIVQLQQPIQTDLGFIIKAQSIGSPKIVHNEIEIAGYPTFVKDKIEYGKLYYDHSSQSISLTSLGERKHDEANQDLRIIQHNLSVYSGQLGSPLFERVSKEKCNLFGIQSGSNFENVTNQKISNFATYIYNRQVYQWLSTIDGVLEEVKPTFINYIGIFNVKDIFGLGILQITIQQQQQVFIFVTLSRYFLDKQSNIKEVYFRRGNQEINFQFHQQNCYKIPIDENRKCVKLGQEGIFIKFYLKISKKLKTKLSDPPSLCLYHQYKYFGQFQAKILGIQRGSSPIKIKSQFSKRILDTDIPQQMDVGLVLVDDKIANKLYINGLFHKDNYKQPNNVYLYKEIFSEMATNKAQKGISSHIRNDISYSLLKIMTSNRQLGIASFLSNGRGKSKFLISHAQLVTKSKFLLTQQQFNNSFEKMCYQNEEFVKKQCKFYRRIVDKQSCNPFSCEMQQMDERFKIKKIYVSKFFLEPSKQIFKNWLSELILQQQIKRYNISIIELEQYIPIMRGFRIRSKQNPRKQLSKNSNHIAFPIIQVKMQQKRSRISFYSQNNSAQIFTQQQRQKSQYELAVKLGEDGSPIFKQTLLQEQNKKGWFFNQNENKDIIIKHKFPVKQGNKGAPMFDQIDANNCYLFGIHAGHANHLNQQGNNFAAYLYNKETIEWLKSIPGLEQVFVKQDEEILVRYSPEGDSPPIASITSSHLSYIGVIELLSEGKRKGYALGIYYGSRLVSLAKYFQHGVRPGKAYFRKRWQNQPHQDTFVIDLSFKGINGYNVLETTGLIRFFGEGDIFAQIPLRNTTRTQLLRLIFKYDQNQVLNDSGQAVGIKKGQEGTSLIAKPFLMSCVANLSQYLSAGVLIMKDKQKSEFFYGFYDNLNNSEQGGAHYFLSKQYLYQPLRPQLKILDYTVLLQVKPKTNEKSYLVLGVKCQDDTIITLASHLKEENEIVCLYLRKEPIQHSEQDFPQKGFSINLEEYERITGFRKHKQIQQVFISIVVKQKRTGVPNFIPSQNFMFNMFNSGVAVGLSGQGNQQRLQYKSFDVGDITTLDVPFSSSLLFLGKTKKDKQQPYFYGFHSTPERRDYHLFEECANSQGQKQFLIFIKNFQKEDIPHLKIPYRSIGMLVDFTADQNYGTAELLYDNIKEECKFLITCAHNFLKIESNVTYDHTDKSLFSQYNFYLPAEDPTSPERQVKKVDNFRIKAIHIPKEYKEYLFKPKSPKKQVCFKEKYPQEKQGIIQVSQHSFYDICIIELETPLKVKHGFRIKRSLRQGLFETGNKGKIQIAGYPKKQDVVMPHTRFYQMHRESNKNHPNYYVQLSNNVKGTGWQIIRHKLSTLCGNSGSPIFYQQGQDIQLFGIHTKGVGDEFNGDYNLATFIYSDHIFNWLISIDNIDSILDQ